MSGLLDVINSPWAIMPQMLEEIRDIYVTHLRGEKIDLKGVEARLGRPLNNERKPYQVVNGAAIIPVYGVMAKRANMFMDVSGGVSTELVGADMSAALLDDDVEQIILDIDSPGGTTDGIDALAERIYGARGTKPIKAFANGTMASAAYYIGSAADSIHVLDNLTQVGSIGVVATIVDRSEAMKKRGSVVHEIYAGKYKRMVSDTKPLTDEGRAYIQDKVDYVYSIFVERVSKYRGVSVQTVLDEMADGEIFTGRQAIDAGLADGVSSLVGLINGAAPKRSKSVPAKEVQTMGDQKPEITAGYILEHHADIAESFREEGRASVDVKSFQEKAAKQERERIQSVMEQSMPGHEALIQQLAFDGKTTGPEAAVQVINAERKAKADNLQKHRDDAPAVVPHAELKDPAPAAAKTPDEKWEADADLRAEFNEDKAAYDAFVKREASGNVRILGGKK